MTPERINQKEIQKKNKKTAKDQIMTSQRIELLSTNLEIEKEKVAATLPGQTVKNNQKWTAIAQSREENAIKKEGTTSLTLIRKITQQRGKSKENRQKKKRKYER